MSFQSDIKTIMTSDTSLNEYFNNGVNIKYVHLPEDFDYTENWLVYDYNMSSQIGSMQAAACYSEYALAVAITSNDSALTNTLSEYLISYLNGASYGSVADISFTSDNRTTVLNKAQNLYQNALSFVATYSPGAY